MSKKNKVKSSILKVKNHNYQSNKARLQSLEEALALHQNGQLDLASAIYRQLIEEDTKNSDALHLLGVIALQTYNYQVAIELINQAIKV